TSRSATSGTASCARAKGWTRWRTTPPWWNATPRRGCIRPSTRRRAWPPVSRRRNCSCCSTCGWATEPALAMLRPMQHVATPALVIGAGPAGLATAASLLERGLRPEVIERGESVGQAWRGHYQRLHLHTVKEHSGLPHFGFPAHFPRYVTREQVVEYL